MYRTDDKIKFVTFGGDGVFLALNKVGRGYLEDYINDINHDMKIIIDVFKGFIKYIIEKRKAESFLLFRFFTIQ